MEETVNKNNEPTYERHDVEGTPFSIYTRDDGKARVSIGMNWVTQELPSIKEAQQAIEEKDWWLICNTIALYTEYAQKYHDEMKNKSIEEQIRNYQNREEVANA